MLPDCATIFSFLLLLTFPKLVWIALGADSRTQTNQSGFLDKPSSHVAKAQ